MDGRNKPGPPGTTPSVRSRKHAIDDAQPKRSNALGIRPSTGRPGYAGGIVMLRPSSTDATARTGRDFGYCSMCPKLSLRLYTAPMLDPGHRVVPGHRAVPASRNAAAGLRSTSGRLLACSRLPSTGGHSGRAQRERGYQNPN